MDTTLISVGELEAGIFAVMLGSVTIGTVTCEKAVYQDNGGGRATWAIHGGPWVWVARHQGGTIVGVYGKRSDAVDGLTEHHNNESCTQR